MLLFCLLAGLALAIGISRAAKGTTLALNEIRLFVSATLHTNGNHDKILPVEDHEELWDFLSQCLRKREFKVTLAHDGRHALETISRERSGIALLDSDLPVWTGGA